MAQVRPADESGGSPGHDGRPGADGIPTPVARAAASDSDIDRSRPPRPSMSDTTPAPTRTPIVPTGVVSLSRWLWLASFVLGLMVAAFAFLSRERLTDRLIERITELDPARSDDTIGRVAGLVFWGSLVALIAIVVIEAILLRVMIGRHGAARFALLLALVLHVVIAALADDVVGTDGEGIWFRALLVLQLVSAGAALVTSFLPGARAWFGQK